MNKVNTKYFYLLLLPVLAFIIYLILNKKEAQLPGSEEEYIFDNGLIFINTAREVKYMGTDACKACHKTSHENFTHTEMFRSFEILDTTNIIESFPQKAPVYDDKTGFYYEMLKKDNRFYQREFRLDKNEKLIYERLVEAQYTIGSGNNLRMYFINENGMFYQLPLTWYTFKQKWDFSPGYKENGNLRFTRYVTKKCMGCHNSYMNEVESAVDRFKEPIIAGIGCERCHGPGEIHIKEMDADNDFELPDGYLSIVNPAKLSRDRMVSVCMQCHLQGKAWSLNNDSTWFDFRPGQLLEKNRSVYFPELTSKEQIEVGDSPHRLPLSKCYTESNGMLTCITCHDPHYSINSFTKNHYNEKCIGCHPVNEIAVITKTHSKTDNCISCHMNQTGKENTLHGVSLTDHWIRVDAYKTKIDWTKLKEPASSGPLVSLIADVDAKENHSLKKGMAYLEYYFEYDRRSNYLDSAINYLLKDSKSLNQSAAGNFALGEIYTEKNDLLKAISFYEKAIKVNPEYADAYFKLGKSYQYQGDLNSSVHYFRKAVNLKPGEPPYLENLGIVLSDLGNIKEAIVFLEKAVSIDGFNAKTFYTLGNIYAVDLQKPLQALKYFKKAVSIDPLIENGYLNLGNTFSLLGKYDEALEAYEKEIIFTPTSALAYVNKGRIYQQLGKIDKAKFSFEKALEIDPDLIIAKEFINNL